MQSFGVLPGDLCGGRLRSMVKVKVDMGIEVAINVEEYLNQC